MSAQNSPSTTIIIGLDACKKGWVAAKRDLNRDPNQLQQMSVDLQVLESLVELDFKPMCKYYIGIDIPIGLLDQAEPGGRSCDRQARKVLSWPRSASVFSPPVRSALRSKTYQEALEINRQSSSCQVGISKQCYYIIPGIKEADIFAQGLVNNASINIFEVHPELSFREMAGKSLESKHSPKGMSQRRSLISRMGVDESTLENFLNQNEGFKEDDLLDALAVSWSTERIAGGTNKSTKAETSEIDSMNLEMKIHW